MKKAYVVPDFEFETFALSESIALNCSVDGINQVKFLNLFSVPIDGNSDAVFFTEQRHPDHVTQVCTYTSFSDEELKKYVGQQYCYFNGINQLFCS